MINNRDLFGFYHLINTCHWYFLNKKITVTMAASKKATVAAEPIIMYTSEIEKKTHYYITILIEY
jgi:hypothetical protein